MKQRLKKDEIQLKLNYFCQSIGKSTYNNNKFICNAKIVYNRKEKNFYFIHPHSEECNDISEVIPNNIKDIKKEAYKLSDFKNILITYLNNNPIINYKTFNKYAQAYFLEKKFSFNLKANTIKNIFYSWKSTKNIFK